MPSAFKTIKILEHRQVYNAQTLQDSSLQDQHLLMRTALAQATHRHRSVWQAA